MDIHDIFKSRRTIRKFKQPPLSEEQLLRYIDSARLAPSAGNMQPLKYIVVHSLAMKERLFPLVKWAAYLAPDYNPKENEKPTAYIVVCADRTIRKSGYEIDVGAAVENLILSAWVDGVGSCIMGAIDRQKIRTLLDIPEELEVSCVISLGYPAEIPRETKVTDSIRYYLDEDGILCVPKREREDVLINIL